MKKVAVILSGCGHLDGAEIRESVLTLLALDSHALEVTCLAPKVDQFHVINHLSGEEVKEKRNVLIESARIARGKVLDIEKANPSDFDAVIIPGGFGVAKNLCDFAFKGKDAQVLSPIKNFLTRIHIEKKPIGAICIAPAMLALLFGNENVELTVGSDEATASELNKLGAKHFNKSPSEVHFDESAKIVTTPAYMYDDAKISDIYKGIKGCVDKTVSLI